jgi:exopolyphosphatase/guanosine-5'-triphosphate,3'-diphosphate pyrophosphatase
MLVMRAATVDIGTNSVLLLIAERSTAGGDPHVLFEDAIITRLGQGVDRQRRLQPDAIARTLEALRSYAARMEEKRVELRAAVGTSALRDAANGADFLQHAEAALGCPVDVIAGQREADLTLRGVASTFAPMPRDTVVCDIGGGSTELIALGEADGVPLRRVSIDIGTVRLTERHIRHDPPSSAELAAVTNSIRESLADLGALLPTRAAQLIGVAGTVTTLLTIERAMETYDSAQVNGARLSRTQIRGLAERLAHLPLDERRRLPGLPPKRADVIVAGALLVAEVMDRLEVGTIFVCDRGVRWGLLYELFGER